MKIRRTVDGLEYEFELTPAEIKRAAMLYEYKCDIEDVEMTCIDPYDKEEFEEMFGITERVFRALIPDIVGRKRELQDDYGMNWSEACHEAAKYVITKYKSGGLK